MVNVYVVYWCHVEGSIPLGSNVTISIIFTQVSLIHIDANDIADGNPSVVLRLIWHIIVYYQVKHTIIA